MDGPLENQVQGNERLRQHRIRRNWRLRDVADQLGTTITTIQRWERGRQQPSAYYRIKLCMLFELTALELGLDEEEASIESEDEEIVASPVIVVPEELVLWTLPYARNPHFTGREELLSQIQQRFTT